MLLIQIQIQIQTPPGLLPTPNAIRHRCDVGPRIPSRPSDNRPGFKSSKNSKDQRLVREDIIIIIDIRKFKSKVSERGY